MAANTAPIFVKDANNSANNAGAMAPTLTTAAADYDGTSVNNALVFTAGADGAFVQRLRFVAKGTNVATVARVYVNNGGDPTVAANNSPYGQPPLPSTTASATAPTPEPDYAMGFMLQPGYRIYVGLGTTVAAGWTVFPVGGNY
jgi:hypothetical protein